jgi:glycosyltransferase involved in cell wall biosynthesis
MSAPTNSRPAAKAASGSEQDAISAWAPDLMLKVPRVVLAVNHPSQYFVPAFRALDRVAVDATVVYWESREDGADDDEFGRHIRWDVDLWSGYRWSSPSSAGSLRRVRDVLTILRHADPQVVVAFGWVSPVALISIAWGWCRRRPVLLYGDSSIQDLHRPRRLAKARRVAVKTLLAHVTGALTTGTFNRDFYLAMGLQPQRLHDSIMPVDLELYSRAANQRVKFHSTLRIGFAGKLIPRKGCDELLASLALLPAAMQWCCVIVGDGAERARLEGLAELLGIAARVEFAGFKNQSEMPEALAGLDVLVVPSSIEPRGLIVTEALAAGVPVIVSDATAVWGDGDLVEDGRSGLVYPSGSPLALARALERLARDRRLRDSLADEGQRRALAQSPDAFASALCAAVRRVVDDA